MATAPGHLLGQIIGNVMEEALEPVLQEMASRHDLYLDSKGPRPGVRPGALVTWTDALGNSHDLDFVLERGGSATKAGNPAVLIEAAWRRYTKHSKAKAQEIQGAVLPVLAKWSNVKPTPAAVVAGQWTAPSLLQMRSNGFVVLHLDFPTTARVFHDAGIDIEGLGEARRMSSGSDSATRMPTRVMPRSVTLPMSFAKLMRTSSITSCPIWNVA